MPSRILVLAAAGSLVATVLTGCASDTEQYCGTLEDKQQELKELAESASARDADLFGESLAVFEDLQAEAPDDVVDEWDTLIFAMEGLDSALDDAGLSAAEYKPGQAPEGVTPEQRAAIEAAAEDLRSQQVTAAGEGIEQHAIDVCDIDLTL